MALVRIISQSGINEHLSSESEQRLVKIRIAAERMNQSSSLNNYSCVQVEQVTQVVTELVTLLVNSTASSTASPQVQYFRIP
jgi:hypothetical protein